MQPNATNVMDPAIAATTWTYQRGSCSVIERGVRIRPTRNLHRKAVQRLPWNSTSPRLGSMTVCDVGPTVAVRRILALYEQMQFAEAAHLLSRLSHGTFGAILPQLPVDLFLEALPHSLPVLEALYAKVFLSDGLKGALRSLRPEAAAWQLVHLFARHEDDAIADALIPSCSKLLRVIVLSEPKVRHGLQARRRSLGRALAGLGQHGLVGASDQTLLHLHDALRLELDHLVARYKAALSKLTELSQAPSTKTPVARSVSFGPAPTQASHQRLLSVKLPEIQERLFRNKSLLDAVQPALAPRALDALLHILQRRVEMDKDALLQFTQLRKDARDIPPDAIVAPVLMRFTRGCQHVLGLMRDALPPRDEPNRDRNRVGGNAGESVGPSADASDSSSDISGYHSDSDSMRGLTSPITSKKARYAALYRSVRSNNRSANRGGSGGSGSDSHEESSRARSKLHKADITVLNSNGTVMKNSDERRLVPRSSSADREVATLRQEVEGLRCELLKAKQTLQSMHDRETKMKDRLAVQAQRMLDRGSKFENVALDEKRPTALIRRYGNLYTQARVDTLDALDALPQLRDAEELKAKLLFSVIVLAFRSVQSTLREIRETVRRVLQMPELGSKDPAADPASREVESSIILYLRRTVDRYDVKKNVEEVCSQIWATLYDYPCLKTCSGLVQYIQDCVKLAWGLSNQMPPFVVEYETRLFRRDMHVRFHTSNQDSDHIKTYLWPALLEGDNGPCVHKGVVIT